MFHGFIRAVAATADLKVADVEYNVEKISAAIKSAEANGADMIVFPELSLCGYTCGDLLLQSKLLRDCLKGLKTLVELTKGEKLLCFVGLPIEKEGRLFNCAAAFSDGVLLGIVPKKNLPNYNEFYEKRYFAEGPASGTLNILGTEVPFGTDILFRAENNPDFTVAAELCEDLWVSCPPSSSHAAAGANIIVNLSASNELVGKSDYRRLLVKSQSARTVTGYVYADAGVGESTADAVFAGHDLIAENGVLLNETELFSCASAVGEIDVELLANEKRKLNESTEPRPHTVVPFTAAEREMKLTRKIDPLPFVPKGEELEKRCELILSLQSRALAERIKRTGSKTAVLGISGGLDSALAFLVTARAFDLLQMDRKNILSYTMPGFGTSGKTKKNALALMESMGATAKTVDITPSVLQHFKDIGHSEEVKDVTYENAQARIRTLILMDVANSTGGLVIGTGDLSELALGWCTYNGDHMSSYSVNSSVPKTLVRALVAYEGKRLGGEAEKVLCGILSTEVSPELLPPEKNGKISQKTEELVGPYELNDFFLYYGIRRGFSPKKIYYLAKLAFGEKYSNEELKKRLYGFFRRFFTQQFKRDCVPNGVKVGSVSLSPRADWRMPSDASAAAWLKEIEEI